MAWDSDDEFTAIDCIPGAIVFTGLAFLGFLQQCTDTFKPANEVVFQVVGKTKDGDFVGFFGVDKPFEQPMIRVFDQAGTEQSKDIKIGSVYKGLWHKKSELKYCDKAEKVIIYAPKLEPNVKPLQTKTANTDAKKAVSFNIATRFKMDRA